MVTRAVCLSLLLLVSVALLHAESPYFLRSEQGNATSQHERLADAIVAGNLADARTAAESIGNPQLVDFDQFLLNNGSKSNQHIIRYFRDTYKLSISDLQIAVMSGNLKIVSDLLPKNDATSSDELGSLPIGGDFHSPLRLAIARSGVEMVKLLLERGSNPNESMAHLGSSFVRDDPTPLKQAIQVGNVEIVKLLLESGVEVQQSAIGYAPDDSNGWDLGAKLWTASKEERLQELNEAVAEGRFVKFDIESANEFGPLSKAIGAGRASVVEALLKAGADPNVPIGGKTTALHMAVRQGHPGIVKILIEAGADVNKPDASEHLPLSLGCLKGDIADLLIAAGAEMRLETGAE